MRPRVLVAGGGVAGLATARALQARGVDATVVERRPAPSPGLGLNLPGNAVRALRHLGGADQVLDAGVRISRREYRTAGDRLMFAVDEDSFWSSVAPSVCVRHDHLVSALAEGLDVRRGLGVERVTDSRGRPTAVLSDGSQQGYDLLVGADGVHSRVRAAVDPKGPRPSLMTAESQRFVIANPGVGCWTAWTGHGVTFLLIPVTRDQAYAYASSSRGGRVDDPGWLSQAFERFPEVVRRAVSDGLASRTAPFRSPVEEVRISTWQRGRVLVLGDAAHATGPVWAQGAALALEDALVLAEVVAGSADWDAVGAEWESRRRPRVRHVQAATDRMSRLAALPDRLAHLLAPVAGPRAYRATYEPLRADPMSTGTSTVRRAAHARPRPRPGT